MHNGIYSLIARGQGRLVNKFYKSKLVLFSILTAGIFLALPLRALAATVSYSGTLTPSVKQISYNVTSGPGAIQAALTTKERDLVLTISNSSGAVIATGNTTQGNITLSRSNLPPGTYTYNVKTTSISFSRNKTFTLKITYPPRDTTLPATSITNPAAGATVTGTVNFSGTATDNNAISKVEFLIGTTLLATDTTAPYATAWDTTKSANGTVTLTVKAYDTSNNMRQASRSVTVNNVVAPPPTCPAGQTGTPPNCVTPPPPTGTFSLKVSADKHRLLDATDKPVFLNGEAAWSLIAQLSREQVLTYLNDRQSKGINTIMMNLLEYKYATNAPRNIYGDAPFTTPHDYATPNETYFAHADFVIQEATKRGMVIMLTPSYIGYGGSATDDGWYNVMVQNGPAKMYAYGQYIGNRYKAYDNIIWVNGGDWDPVDKSVVDELAKGIKSVDTNNLHTAHVKYNEIASGYWDTASWLDIDNVYHYDDVYAPSRTIYQANKRPAFLFESRYENEQNVSPAQLRAQAYQPVLAGGVGNLFSNCPLWHFDAIANWCSGSAVGWDTQLNSPGSLSMEQFGKLFRSRSWQDLVPDFNHNVMIAGYSSGGLVYDAAARTANGNTVIAYYTSSKALTFDMTKISGTSARAWWFNPSNGATTNLGIFPTTGTRSFTPPTSGDWVLVLDDASLNLGAPGTNETLPPETCPAGQTGTPPNCVTPPPDTCPAGQTGTPPNCVTPPSSGTFPLKLSTDRRRLLDATDKPVLLNGDTAWNLVTQISKEKAVTYLNDRQAKGINAILVNLMVYKYATNAPNNFYGQGPFTTPNDFSTPNEAYFANVDYVFQEAKNRNMVLVVAPAFLGYDHGDGTTPDGWYNAMVQNGPAKMYAFGQYLGNRYKNYDNIIWVNGGDRDPADKAVVDELAKGIKSTDTNGLHTAHTRYNENASTYWDSASWLDIDSVYNYNDVYGPSRSIYWANKRPFFMLESRYENDANVTQAQLRAQAYHPILAGSNGHIFGSCPIWNFDGYTSLCTNYPGAWESQLNSPGITSMQHLGKLFKSRAWQDLIPDFDHTVMTAGYTWDWFNYDVAARTSNGNTVIAYIPTANYHKGLTFDMTKVSGTSAKVWWYNPSNGAATNIGTFPTSGTRQFITPTTDDWVLVMDDASLNLAAPGN